MEYFLMSMMAAAKELAQHPEYAESYEAQDLICRKFGFSLEDITEDEIKYLFSLVNDFM